MADDRIRRETKEADQLDGQMLTYKDSKNLSRFMDDRGKILSRTKTGTSAKQQRRLTREIKRARSLGLLPLTQS